MVYDVTGCELTGLGTTELVGAMRKTAALLGCTVLGELPVQFQPHGATAVIVLAESHITVSTWPEIGLAHIDVFTCRADAEVDDAVAPVLAALRAGEVKVQEVTRLGPPTSSRSTVESGASGNCRIAQCS
ncbi:MULTISPECIES: adenosylmethionine decarboxylase [unclassified Amycolatopsis]|uniref:adenosylmethionine decarboxylase n=1 Tax=unclassified Amycolatopsis TaxID=2618356 RepID=UPI00287B9860|nr:MULTISPECIES: adenosylmethionine decarboxylase [unclassified Amycolatopsis]